ncbi:MAG: HAD-IB family hydrolase [Zoogloeaceae bacterium]|jgi:HAD superfamily hydrolase (TIGR01490 family)|nr:HAD-IB family hydrolase [Zoogloeaceae bacterium]
MTNKIIAAFDFDGTITTRDTFLAFLARVFGKPKLYGALFCLSGEALRVWLGRASRDRFKALLMGRLFSGCAVAELRRIGAEHAAFITRWCRPAALERIRWHKEQGHRLVMVSASLSFYLEPIARQLGFDDLLCTELASTEGVCSGELQGENCRAAEKVRRLQSLLGALDDYEIYAYGDSDGDTEMLAAADHPAFKPFRALP